MNKIKYFINSIQKNSNIKYFLILTIICFSMVGVFRPIIHKKLDVRQVSVTPAPAKKKLPIYSVATDEKKVAISFDAAWGADDTEDLLKILRDNNVKATFFLCGTWVDAYPDKVKRIYEEGHEIGNHSNTHPHGSQISLEQNKKEIMQVHEKIKNLLGIDINLYRPPFGEYNDTVLQAAKECSYHAVQWDVELLEIKIEVV